MTDIQGSWEPWLDSVVDAFADGFSQGDEVGASLAILRGGVTQAYVWAGHTDRKRSQAWQEDTLCCGFSIAKAITALCVLQAVSEGLIDLDDAVQAHWPEFVGHGKETLSVRALLAHRSGLVAFHEPQPKDFLYSWDQVVEALAQEQPWWQPDTAHGYHARTFGFLAGEMLQRASGMRPQAWLQQRLAGPRQIDYHLGLPTSEHDRCATMIPARIVLGKDRDAQADDGSKEFMRDIANPKTITGAVFGNPNSGPGYMNKPEFRSAEQPSASGFGTALGIAQLFACYPSLLSKELLAEVTKVHSAGPDQVLKQHTTFGLGVMLHTTATPMGLGPTSFGHGGAGGGVGFHDLDTDISFAYVMNNMELGVISGGTGARHITQALSDVVKGM